MLSRVLPKVIRKHLWGEDTKKRLGKWELLSRQRIGWNSLDVYSSTISLFFFFLIFIYLFLVVLGLRWGAQASHCSGFSCCRTQAAGVSASVVAEGWLSNCGSRAPEHWLRSCSTPASLLLTMWELPRPGVEPMTPALAGGFSTTRPPGKPNFIILSTEKLRCQPCDITSWDLLISFFKGQAHV